MLITFFLLVLADVLLLSYYEFESDARDRSGFAINADGEFIDTAGISTDAAIGSGALKLGGYTDYVDLGNDSKFDMIDEIILNRGKIDEIISEAVEKIENLK